jgi:hypothetical protein
MRDAIFVEQVHDELGFQVPTDRDCANVAKANRVPLCQVLQAKDRAADMLRLQYSEDLGRYVERARRATRSPDDGEVYALNA